ncbi:hypothetical protein FB446DRAFT_484066 [Lentinula raphanica]|nr:hypothetical protein FB446DRAFT_484066 [Lentinula raphanica]
MFTRYRRSYSGFSLRARILAVLLILELACFASAGPINIQASSSSVKSGAPSDSERHSPSTSGPINIQAGSGSSVKSEALGELEPPSPLSSSGLMPRAHPGNRKVLIRYPTGHDYTEQSDPHHRLTITFLDRFDYIVMGGVGKPVANSRGVVKSSVTWADKPDTTDYHFELAVWGDSENLHGEMYDSHTRALEHYLQ